VYLASVMRDSGWSGCPCGRSAPSECECVVSTPAQANRRRVELDFGDMVYDGTQSTSSAAFQMKVGHEQRVVDCIDWCVVPLVVELCGSLEMKRPV